MRLRPRPCRLVLALLACAALPAALLAGPTGRRLTPEQALNLRRPSDLRFSPDGARLAFVVSEPPHGADNFRHVWLLDVASGRARQYTYSSKSDDSPRWSPDGKYLALLSNRDGNRQIYLLPTAGGDAFPLTSGKRDIASFAWSPDGRRIAFLAPDPPTPEQTKKQADKDDAIVVDHEARHARLWLLDLPADPASSVPAPGRALTSPAWTIRSFDWMPAAAGAGLIAVATDHPESDDNSNAIYEVSTASGALRLLYKPQGPFGSLAISPDGRRLAYLASADAGPEPHDAFVRPLAAPAVEPSRDLTSVSLDRALSGLVWNKDGKLYAAAQTGFETTLYRISPDDGSAVKVAAAAPNPRTFALGPNSAVAFVGQTATQPPELYLAHTGDAARRVTDLNASWAAVELARPSFFHYSTFDGLQIEGELLRPLPAPGAAAAPPPPYPLVVLVHGGPTGAWSDAVEAWGQLLAAHGFAAAYFNIRGSTGYGVDFMEKNRADWGGADFKDVMAGVDDLVRQGIADPNRLGIGGWSYGGYMAEWAITQTHRFKAAVSGAGMVDLIAEFDTENGPAYDKWFWGLPYDRPQPMIQHSPFAFLKNARTPILILQGINDTTDPLGQSTGLYRGLKFYGAPAELVEYPRENHGFHEQQHQLDRLNRILAWYEKYLK